MSVHAAEKYCRRVHFDQMPWSKSLSRGEGNPLRQLHPQDVLHFSRGPGGWQHHLGQGSRMWLVCGPWDAWDMLHEMQLEKAQRCPQQGWEVPRDLNLFSSSGHSRCVRVCGGCTCTCDRTCGIVWVWRSVYVSACVSVYRCTCVTVCVCQCGGTCVHLCGCVSCV